MKKSKQIFFQWLFLAVLAGVLITFSGCSDSFQDLGPDPSETFVKFHGGGYAQEAVDLLPKGNGFLLLGTTFTSSLGLEGQLYLVETDGGGNEISTNTIGTGIPNTTGSANSLSATGDGFLLSGTIMGPGGRTDAWLVKVDENLETAWTFVYGDPMFDETGMAAVETATGEVYLLGTTNDVDMIKGKGDAQASDLMDMLLVKVDPGDLTNPVWEKTFGYTGLDEGSDLLDLGDGTLALLGTTDYPEGAGSQDKDILVVIVNEDGNAVDTRHFGGSGEETASRMTLTPGGELAITGNVDQNILFMTVGTTLEVINGPVEITAGVGRDIASKENGNFLLTGHAGNADNEGSQDLLLLEVDGAGVAISSPIYFGNKEGDDFGAAVIRKGNGIAVLGTMAFGSNRMMGLIKTNEMGELNVIQ